MKGLAVSLAHLRIVDQVDVAGGLLRVMTVVGPIELALALLFALSRI